jgi:pimeloyl-ACP methyl ester carboxylesterase
MTAEYAQALVTPDPVERARRSIELSFGEKYRCENPEMMELIINAATSGSAGVTPIGPSLDGGAGFIGQATAVARWMLGGGAASRLGRITAPTLVVHGTADLLIPVENGELLARDIPGAVLRIFSDAGHAVNHERAEDVNSEVVAHLEAASAKV